MAKKGQKFINYSVEFKLLAVNKYLEGEMAYTAIAKELGVYDHSYIRRWVKNYREFGVEGLKERRGKSRSPLKGRPRTNNEIVAYKVSHSNNLKLVVDTVKEAIKKQDVHGVTLHSDQGFQYTSRQYHKLLKKHKITPSMSRKGNCLDNACMENFFGHLKSELMYLHSFQTEEEVIQAIDQYIYFYNHKRFQKKLSNLSPVEYRNTKVA